MSSDAPGVPARLFNVLGKLLLLFTVVPVVELYLLITIGQNLGAGATVAIVLTTGLLGAGLAKREGARVLRNWQESLERGQMPKEGVVSSLLVLVGGVLLVTPGVVTDVSGLLLLVPWSRRLVASVVRKRLEHRFQMQSFVANPASFIDMASAGMSGPQGSVIDVDVVEAESDAEVVATDASSERAEPPSSFDRALERPAP